MENTVKQNINFTKSKVKRSVNLRNLSTLISVPDQSRLSKKNSRRPTPSSGRVPNSVLQTRGISVMTITPSCLLFFSWKTTNELSSDKLDKDSLVDTIPAILFRHGNSVGNSAAVSKGLDLFSAICRHFSCHYK